MNHEFIAEARQEFLQAVSWYSERSQRAAENFQNEIESAIQAILKEPGRCQPAGDDARVFRLKRFPFKLYYMPLDSTVIILAVMHNKRRPDYWRKRLH